MIKNHWKNGKILIKKIKILKRQNYFNLIVKKTNKILKWKPSLNLKNTIYLTGIWYKKFYEKKIDMYEFSLFQLKNFLNNEKLK